MIYFNEKVLRSKNLFSTSFVIKAFLTLVLQKNMRKGKIKFVQAVLNQF